MACANKTWLNHVVSALFSSFPGSVLYISAGCVCSVAIDDCSDQQDLSVSTEQAWVYKARLSLPERRARWRIRIRSNSTRKTTLDVRAKIVGPVTSSLTVKCYQYKLLGFLSSRLALKARSDNIYNINIGQRLRVVVLTLQLKSSGVGVQSLSHDNLLWAVCIFIKILLCHIWGS